MADKMIELASKQNGFLGVESAREEVGITVSYWKDLDSIKKWRENTNHEVAREKGKADCYSFYKIRIARIERAYEFQM